MSQIKLEEKIINYYHIFSNYDNQAINAELADWSEISPYLLHSKGETKSIPISAVKRLKFLIRLITGFLWINFD